MNILIVEDDLLTIKRIQSDLEDAGHTITGSARNLSEAMRLFREIPPDLVLLDISFGGMDNMDGLELACWLGELNQKPYIFLTGHQEPPPGVEGTRSYSYITKPYRKSELLMQVRLAYDRFTEAKNAKEAGGSFPDSIYLRVNGHHVRIPFDELLYVKAERRRVSVHTVHTGDSPYQIGTNLGDIAHFFTHPGLIFIEPSVIVNRKYIFDIKGDTLVIGPEPRLLKLSVNARKKLLNELHILKTGSRRGLTEEWV